MSKIPANLLALLHSAFDAVDNPRVAEDLKTLALALYERAYDTRLQLRTAEDNRPEHELVVLRNTMRICWRSGHERLSGYPFDRQELRVAVATSLLHDLRFIPRITEEMINNEKDPTKAEQLRKAKADQRILHMRGSAEDALQLLHASRPLMTDEEIQDRVGYISLHDIWKLDWPYPASSDWLAVCCLEGDALWPLDPDFGPLADLERKGRMNPTRNELQRQAASNLDTQLRNYRKNFAFSADHFRDDETIIRTSEGERILKESMKFWESDLPPK